MYDATLVNATSTSVSLLYAERPTLNFAAYVSRMEQALRGSFEDTLKMTWDHEDVVVIDVDGSRVLVGYWEAPEGSDSSCAAVLVLSVGPGPDWRAQTRLSRFRKSLCQSVAAGIMERNPADMVLWKDFQGVFMPEDFDSLIDDALAVGANGTPAIEGSVVAAPSEADMSAPDVAAELIDAASDFSETRKGSARTRFGEVPVRRLMDRLETEISPGSIFADNLDTDMEIRQERRAAPVAGPIANDIPDLPAPDLPDVERIRLALYPPDEAEGKPDLTQRLTIYTVNTTLMLVSLPVGAALLTYNILGGEDAKMTARAVALTGAVMGIAQGTFGHYLMSLV